jgi:hypothetical protein
MRSAPNPRSIRWGDRQEFRVRQVVPTVNLFQQVAAITYASGAATAIFSPTLDLLDQVASFQAIFDQYRIDRLTWTFRPMFARENFSALTGGGTHDIVPQIYTVLDFTDNIIPTAVSQLHEFSNCETHMVDTFARSCKPSVLVSVNGGLEPIVSPWLATDQNSAVHYGLKLAIDSGDALQAYLQTFVVTLTIECTFRNVK